MDIEQNKFFINILLKKSRYPLQIREMVELRLKTLRSVYPAITDEDFDLILDEANISQKNKLEDFLVNYLTLDECKSVISFYSSPAGKKIIDREFTSKINNIVTSIVNEAEKKLLNEKNS